MSFNPFQYIGIDPDEDDEIFARFHEADSGIYTSSMVSDILGFGYTSRNKRWEKMTASKRGEKPKEENEFSKKAMEYGKNMEPFAVEDFFEQFPKYTGIKPGLAMIDEKFAACTDQLLLDKSDTRCMLVLEIKCPEIPKDIVLPHEIPSKWLAQLQFEMKAFQVKDGFLYIYQPHAEEPLPKRILFHVFFDNGLFEAMKNEVLEFDREYVQTNKRPPKRKTKNQNILRLLCNTVIKLS